MTTNRAGKFQSVVNADAYWIRDHLLRGGDVVNNSSAPGTTVSDALTAVASGSTIPDASALVRGLVNIVAQTFAGTKTFLDAPVISTNTFITAAGNELSFPDNPFSTIITDNAVQSMGNKTISDTTNIVHATHVRSTLGPAVDVRGVGPGGSDEVLLTSSSTAARWFPLSFSAVTSLAVGTTGTDVAITGPVSPTGALTLNVPSASATARGVVTTAAQTFAGVKTFSSPPVFSAITNTGTITLPTATDTLVGKATTDTLTNKTATGATNVLTARLLKSATTEIDCSAATAPTAGQVFTATSSTTANWQTPTAGGVTTLNTQTGTTQTFATATTGTDFTITSATNTHTFAIPDASATARGLVTTGAQTFAGAKTFSAAPVFSAITNTGTITLPTATDTLVGRATTDTLTNKTATGATNTLTARLVKTATNEVDLSASAAPIAGYGLVASGATTAAWATIPIVPGICTPHRPQFLYSFDPFSATLSTSTMTPASFGTISFMASGNIYRIVGHIHGSFSAAAVAKSLQIYDAVGGIATTARFYYDGVYGSLANITTAGTQIAASFPTDTGVFGCYVDCTIVTSTSTGLSFGVRMVCGSGTASFTSVNCRLAMYRVS